MTKILLDTDIGTDVDDAVCLAYLLAHPDCELLGITTVTGEPEKRAAIASALTIAAGRPEIPIYPGAGIPLEGLQRQTVAQQAAALHLWPHETNFPQGEAVEFLRQTIRAHPGEVYLLTIGPLTNIGTLFQSDPEIPRLLKGLVMMAGRFFTVSTGYPVEWNTAGDPRASEIVYASPVRLHRSVGLDVTQQVVLPEAEVRRRFTAPLLRPVLDFAEIWFTQFYKTITFHDPLAAATIFDETLCTWAQGMVTIDRQEQAGKTLWKEGDASAPHQIATSVDVGRYFEDYFRVLR